MRRLLILLVVLGFSAIAYFSYFTEQQSTKPNFKVEMGNLSETAKIPQGPANKPSTTLPAQTAPSPTVQVIPAVPIAKTLSNNYHVFQSFNNCGPAALSMTLSYYNISVSQQELGQALRPYQIANGDNDDKSVTLAELAEKSKDYGLIPFHRPNGTLNLIKQFIANDIPVIARTRSTEKDDIGHYRIIKGFDDRSSDFIQDDSLQGKNLKYSYDKFFYLWKLFNNEYLVLVPKEKEQLARTILGENADEKTAWRYALANSNKELITNPDDIYARFNASIAFYHLGEYQNSVNEYEKVATKLPFRTLWYQIEPIQAYFQLGRYDRVFAITDSILNNHNRAYSELYVIRGNIYKLQGNIDAAKREYDKAIYYNKNLKEAQQALSSLL